MTSFDPLPDTRPRPGRYAVDHVVVRPVLARLAVAHVTWAGVLLGLGAAALAWAGWAGEPAGTSRVPLGLLAATGGAGAGLLLLLSVEGRRIAREVARGGPVRFDGTLAHAVLVVVWTVMVPLRLSDLADGRGTAAVSWAAIPIYGALAGAFTAQLVLARLSRPRVGAQPQPRRSAGEVPVTRPPASPPA